MRCPTEAVKAIAGTLSPDSLRSVVTYIYFEMLKTSLKSSLHKIRLSNGAMKKSPLQGAAIVAVSIL